MDSEINSDDNIQEIPIEKLPNLTIIYENEKYNETDYLNNKVQEAREMINNNILSEDEIEIVNRGRNADSHKSKTTDIVTYKKATGLECLIGYLYKNNLERCNEIMNFITGE